MSGCGCGGSQGLQGPVPLKNDELDELARSGTAIVQSIFNRDVRSSSYRLGVTSTPDNAVWWTNVFGDAGPINRDWTVVVHIPVGKHSAVIEIKNDSKNKNLCFRAALSMDNTPSVALEIKFCVGYDVSNIRNFTGLVEEYQLVSNAIGISASCLEECIKRHAPKCIGPCLKDPTGWSCIICAGGAIACCLVNCHC